MRLLVRRQGAATGRFKMPHGQGKRRTDETKTPEEKLKNAERNERRPGISRRGFFPSGLTMLMPIQMGSGPTNRNRNGVTVPLQGVEQGTPAKRILTRRLRRREELNPSPRSHRRREREERAYRKLQIEKCKLKNEGQVKGQKSKMKRPRSDQRPTAYGLRLTDPGVTAETWRTQRKACLVHPETGIDQTVFRRKAGERAVSHRAHREHREHRERQGSPWRRRDRREKLQSGSLCLASGFPQRPLPLPMGHRQR
jgi:hypothetical protein